MSVGIPLKIVNGTTQQLATGDNVSANGMEQRSGTALTLGNASTTGIDIGTGVGLTALNIGSGYTGAAQIINVGTSATTGSVINLGSASSQVVVPGTMTVTTTAAFDGATTIGTSPGTDSDTLTVYAMTTFTAGRVTGSIDFKKETAGHALTVVDSTTRAAAGSPLTVRSAAGATDGGVGGVLSLKSGAGGDVVQGTNTSFAASAGTTTFVTPQALFVGGDVGRTIRIAGSTTNNGDFTIASYISPTSVTWATGVGLTEAGAGTWEFTSVLGQAGGAVSMIGGSGGIGSADLAAGTGGAVTVSGGSGGAGAVGGYGGALTLTSGAPTGNAGPGVLSIQSGGADILTVDAQGNVVLKTIADDSVNTLSLSTGNNSFKGGGAFSVVTGNGGSSTTAVGGKISLTAGNGGSGTGADGGAVEITAGNGGSTTGVPGAVTILGGTSPMNSVVGGSVTLTGGVATAAVGGAVALNGGASSSATGGAVNLTGGASVTGAGADINLLGGAATAGTANGGWVTLQGGASAGGQSGGVIAVASAAVTAGGAISLNQTSKTVSLSVGDQDPTVATATGNTGSLYLRSRTPGNGDGELYVATKPGFGATTWAKVTVAGSVSLNAAYLAGSTVNVKSLAEGGDDTVMLSGEGAATDTLTVTQTGGGGPSSGNGLTLTMQGYANYTGTGDSLTFAAGPNTVTLNCAAAFFTAAYVGQPITITGSTNPANDGTFTVTAYNSATSITWVNASGVTETSSLGWSLTNKSSGMGAYIWSKTNTTGTSLMVNNQGTGDAVFINNVASGNGLYVNNASAATGPIARFGGDNFGNVLVLSTTGAITGTAANGSGATAGSAVSFTAGNGGAAGVGGSATLRSGNGGSASVAGTVYVTGGTNATANTSGNLELTAGDNSFAGAGTPGTIYLQAGSKTSTSATVNAGAIDIRAGNGAGAGGNAGPVLIYGGNNTDAGGGLGGDATLAGGQKTNAGGTAAAGDAYVLGGANAGSGVGGSVNLTGGTSSTGKAGGVVATTSRTASGVVPATDGPVLTLTQAAGSASVWVGATSPNGNVSGTQGSLYLKTDGTVYVNTTTGTTWTQLAASGGTSLQSAYDAATPTIALDNSGGLQFTQADGAGVGAATLSLTNAEDGAANNTLTVNRSPAATPANGFGVSVTMGANALEAGLDIVQFGTGASSHGANINVIGPTDALSAGLMVNVQNAGSAGTGVNIGHSGTGAALMSTAFNGGLAASFSSGNTAFGNAVTVVHAGTGAGSALDVTATLGHGGITVGAVNSAGVAITMTGTGAALIADQTSTGNIAEFRDNGSAILTLTGAGAITAEPTSGQNFTVQSKGGATAIALNTTTGVAPTGAITIDSAAGVSINAATSSNFTVASGAALELTFGAHGSTIDLNTLADPSLVGFTKQSIVGALNELKVGTTAASQIVQTGFDTATNLVTSGQLGYMTTGTSTVAKGIATSLTSALVFGANEGTAGSMTTAGTIEGMKAEPGLLTPIAGGDRLFLSAVAAGTVTNLAPSTLTQVVIPVGYARTAGSGGTTAGAMIVTDGFTSGAPVTLAVAGAFVAGDVGRTIWIRGATSAGNNGYFVILSVTPGVSCTYTNASAVTEAALVTTTYDISAATDMLLAIGSPVVL